MTLALKRKEGGEAPVQQVHVKQAKKTFLIEARFVELPQKTASIKPDQDKLIINGIQRLAGHFRVRCMKLQSDRQKMNPAQIMFLEGEINLIHAAKKNIQEALHNKLNETPFNKAEEGWCTEFQKDNNKWPEE